MIWWFDVLHLHPPLLGRPDLRSSVHFFSFSAHQPILHFYLRWSANKRLFSLICLWQKTFFFDLSVWLYLAAGLFICQLKGTMLNRLLKSSLHHLRKFSLCSDAKWLSGVCWNCDREVLSKLHWGESCPQLLMQVFSALFATQSLPKIWKIVLNKVNRWQDTARAPQPPTNLQTGY